MAEKIPMLALSPTMEEGLLLKWLKNEGDTVAQSDVLCEVETDKATMEYESPAEGTILKILAGEQTKVAVGATIAIIGEPGEDISGLLAEAPPAVAPESDQAVIEKVTTIAETAPAEVIPSDGKVKSSPMARKLAADHGLDISMITGTGPDGRITKADVENAAGRPAAAGTPAVSFAPISAPLANETIDVTPKRQLIAQKLSESKLTSPHYYLTVTAKVGSLIEARRQINEKHQAKVSLNAFLIKLTTETLKKHPMVNATWKGETIDMHGSIDVALAVAQPDGLIAPAVRNCGAKGIFQIDSELKALIDKTQKGNLTGADYENSTFTITNLGSMGIEEFTAIINPPNSAILAVGKISKTPVVCDNDQIGVEQTMKMTLSCDHRIIDGAVGARFLSDLKDMVENPLNALC